LSKKINILITPLEWGLGHAGRMIPVAKWLLERGHKVYAAAGKEHLALFEKEVPGILLIDFPGFTTGYSKHLPQYLFLLIKIPLLIYHIIKEHKAVSKILRTYSIGLLISDNRFGVWNSSVKTVYFTHLLRVPMPPSLRWMEPLGTALHRLIINRYDYCFIPDLPGEMNLSGRLSHGLKLPASARYTGILSRFGQDAGLAPTKAQHITVILSGPEPQRSMLRELLAARLRQQSLAAHFLCGQPSATEYASNDGLLTYHGHLTRALMEEVIVSGRAVIARSGYTTLMELVSLGCSALIIPTPGQPEQEYLAEYLASKGMFKRLKQSDISGADLSVPDITISSEEIVAESRKLFEAAFCDLLLN
jgi:Glycosyltransferase family 28 C-terminal domain